MPQTNRQLTVLTDGIPLSSECRFYLSGKCSVGLFPDLFLLEGWNLSDHEVYQLRNSKNISVMHGDSCLAFGQISDVFCRTVPEGTITTMAFSLGLDLWEAQVLLAVQAGATVSETVRQLLAASGTGIPLLSFPGADPVVSRGQAFCGWAAESITVALTQRSDPGADANDNAEGSGASAAVDSRRPCARAYLVPAGLCIIPAEPLPASLHLSDLDLTDRPAFVGRGKKMILSTTVTGFQPGEEMTMTYGEKSYAGLILERLVDADTGDGPWRTQLLVELH